MRLGVGARRCLTDRDRCQGDEDAGISRMNEYIYGYHCMSLLLSSKMDRGRKTTEFLLPMTVVEGE